MPPQDYVGEVGCGQFDAALATSLHGKFGLQSSIMSKHPIAKGAADGRSRGGIVVVLLLAVAAVAAALALYTVFVLHWSYSEGQRAGILQKFSRKGWVCKTWEGELAMSIVPGVTPTIWDFSVRDAGVAQRMNAAVGRRVTLHYTEHRGVPTSCFAETPYFVDDVRVVE